MTLKIILLPLGALAFLTACDAQIGNSADGQAAVSGENSAESGQLSLKAPGVNISLDIPEGLRDLAQIDSNAKLLPPNVQFDGMAIQGATGADGQDNGGVELRFTAPEAPQQVLAWYQAAERAANFAIDGTVNQDGATVIRGHTVEGGNGGFSVRLQPNGNGGTDGRLVLTAQP